MAEEFITVAQARELLGFSKVKMSRMIREGVLATVPDQWDGRVKLIRRSEVDALRRALRNNPRLNRPQAMLAS
jgi:excisionase family DNA binding protein